MQNLVLAALNHLICTQPWAQARLRPFYGCHGRLIAGPVNIGFVIALDGQLLAASALQDDVTITLPADAPQRWSGDPAAVMAGAQVSGRADFAEALGFVFKNLRWDVEADLARIFGDLAAHRLAGLGRRLAQQAGTGTRRLGANLSEALVHEHDLLIETSALAAHAVAIARVDDQCTRLEARLLRVEQRRQTGKHA